MSGAVKTARFRPLPGVMSRGTVLAEWSELVLEPATRLLMVRVKDWLAFHGMRPAFTAIGGQSAQIRFLVAVVRPRNLDTLVRAGVRPFPYDAEAARQRALAFNCDLADWAELIGAHRGPRLNALRGT